MRSMFRIVLGLSLLTMAIANSAVAGFSYQLGTFNGAVAQSTFNLGETVTVRLFAVDTAGPNVDFATQNIRSFTANLVASTSDLAPTSATTFNPGFSTGSFVGLGDFFTAGRVISATAPIGGFAAPIGVPLQLAEFSYVANVAGPTTISFGPAATNDLTYYTSGSTGAQITSNPGAFIGTTVTAVPEPSTIALLGLVAVGCGMRRLRRRN